MVAAGPVGGVLDISDSMNAAEALKSRDRRFRALIEGSIQGVLVHRDNQVLFANKECARILGFKDLDDLPGGPRWIGRRSSPPG